MQKGLVAHQPGKTQRNTHPLTHGTAECDQQGLLGMTELLTGRKGIRQSSPGTMAGHTHMQTWGAKIIECNFFCLCVLPLSRTLEPTASMRPSRSVQPNTIGPHGCSSPRRVNDHAAVQADYTNCSLFQRTTEGGGTEHLPALNKMRPDLLVHVPSGNIMI